MLPSCPLWENPLLTAGGKTLSNETGKDYNTQNLGQIVKQNKIISFPVFKNIFALNDSVFLQYLQIKSILKEYVIKGISLPSDVETDNKLKEIMKKIKAQYLNFIALFIPLPVTSWIKLKHSGNRSWGKPNNRAMGNYNATHKLLIKMY